MSAFSAFGTAIGSFGASYLIAAHYQIIDISEKKKMISTITIVGLILAMAFSAGLLILWPAIKALFPIFANIPFIGLALSLLAMVLGIPWVFAYDVVVLDGKSKFYAILLVMQCIISSLMMVLCLYVFKFGLLALFIGPVFGNLITFSGAIWYLHPYLELSIHKEWLGKLWKLGFIGVTLILQRSCNLCRKSILSVYVGFKELGIYAHSQSYKSLAMIVMKASARTVLITLSESREIDGKFVQTKRFGIQYMWQLLLLVLLWLV